MEYWLWLAILFSPGAGPGHWSHYPIDGFESEKDCQDAVKLITSNFEIAYQEKPGEKWFLYCRAQGKT